MNAIPNQTAVNARRLALLLCVCAVLCVSAGFAQDGYWVNGSGGSWSSAANWDAVNGIAGGADSTAYFGFGREAVIGPNASFTLDGTRTVGNICFTNQGGTANWTFSPGTGGALMLDSTFSSPQISITSPSLQVTLNVAIGGTSGLEKDGPRDAHERVRAHRGG